MKFAGKHLLLLACLAATSLLSATADAGGIGSITKRFRSPVRTPKITRPKLGNITGKFHSGRRGIASGVQRRLPRTISSSGLADAFKKKHPKRRIGVKGLKQKYDATRRNFHRKARRAGYRKPSASKAAAERQRWKLRALTERDNAMRFLNKTNGNQGDGSNGSARGEGRQGERRVGPLGASLRGHSYRRPRMYHPSSNSRSRFSFPRRIRRR